MFPMFAFTLRQALFVISFHFDLVAKSFIIDASVKDDIIEHLTQNRYFYTAYMININQLILMQRKVSFPIAIVLLPIMLHYQCKVLHSGANLLFSATELADLYRFCAL